MEFEYDQEKNEILKQNRGVTFENIITEIKSGKFLIVDHHNKDKYSGQIIILVELDNYIYAVPCKVHGNKIVFTTIYKSRKFNKLYKNKIKGDNQ